LVLSENRNAFASYRKCIDGLIFFSAYIVLCKSAKTPSPLVQAFHKLITELKASLQSWKVAPRPEVMLKAANPSFFASHYNLPFYLSTSQFTV
jgi:hypothetical protein